MFASASRGFALLEMVMVIMLLSILFISSAPMVSQGFSAARVSGQQMDTMAKLHYAVERIGREIRQVNYNGSSYQITTAGTTQVVFSKNDSVSTEVDIRQAGALLKLKYFNASLNVDSDLSNELSDLQFRYLTANNVVTTDTAQMAYVEVTVTLTNTSANVDFSQRLRIALRDRG